MRERNDSIQDNTSGEAAILLPMPSPFADHDY